MGTDQYALYRVDRKTAGKDLWRKPYEQVRKEKRKIWIGFYKQIQIVPMRAGDVIMDIWERTADVREVSDVIVINQDGEIFCFYVDEKTPRRISGFIRINSSGAQVTLDTKDYQIDGMDGNWMAVDEVIIDGRQFFLMEHQEYHRQTAMVILDAYGKKVIEEFREGDKRKVRGILREYVRNSQIRENGLDKREDSQKDKRRMAERLELWQKAYENGHYERSWESGTEVNYDAVDGCVNLQKDNPGKALSDAEKKPKKRVSVVKKLREKQIAIAKRTGRPIPKYLEQQMVREKD